RRRRTVQGTKDPLALFHVDAVNRSLVLEVHDNHFERLMIVRVECPVDHAGPDMHDLALQRDPQRLARNVDPKLTLPNINKLMAGCEMPARRSARSKLRMHH